eukprot:1880469-Rhodomonas_salina.2
MRPFHSIPFHSTLRSCQGMHVDAMPRSEICGSRNQVCSDGSRVREEGMAGSSIPHREIKRKGPRSPYSEYQECGLLCLISQGILMHSADLAVLCDVQCGYGLFCPEFGMRCPDLTWRMPRIGRAHSRSEVQYAV